MRRILILGGTGEARKLAEDLSAEGRRVIYSVAGLTSLPCLTCEVRRGGFGGVSGLSAYLAKQRVDLLVDATHPYAKGISRNARIAASLSGVCLWTYHRPGWTQVSSDDWRWCADWAEIVEAIKDFARPFFTIGHTPFEHLDEMPRGQRWLVRALQAPRRPQRRLTAIVARGPFDVPAETRLMREHRIDVLVSKDSGGDAVAAKILVARALGIPVVMWARSSVPDADRLFYSAVDLARAVLEYSRAP